MKLWPRPSLQRRIALALLAAFLLVWGVLSVKEYWGFRQDAGQQQSLGRIADVLLDSLPESDADLAREIVVAADRQYNALRQLSAEPPPGKLLFVLGRRDGGVVYSSDDATGLALPPDASGQLQLAGRNYWAVQREKGFWRLVLLDPAMTDRHALALISAELLSYLAIALPLILLPVWIAVRRGLRPLRTFSANIAQRGQDDFTPLTEPTRYAELQPLVEAFNHLLGKARHSLERERAFVQDAAHELRTPLAVVASQAHVLAGASSAEQRTASLRALEQAVARASHWVGQLLALAALDKRAQGAVQGLDLVEKTRAVMIQIAPAAAARNIEIALESPDSLPTHLDVLAFHSLLENLLNNAVAYCPPGARIVVELAERGGRIRLSVADDGPGIDPTEQARIFERFYRGRTATAPGSGLGLAIVRQAVATLGGTVEIGAGLDGRGVAFIATWPAQTALATPHDR